MMVPLKKIRITQKFNDICCRKSYSQFGLLGHNGVDYGCVVGAEVYAPHAGVVLEATNDVGGYGKYIKIESAKEGSILAHLDSIKVSVGQQVNEGDLIGLSGNTGNSTGPHLHWGYYQIPRDKTNGFNGYIDQYIVFKTLEDTDQCPEYDYYKERAGYFEDALKMFGLIVGSKWSVFKSKVQETFKTIEDQNNKIKKLMDEIAINITPLSHKKDDQYIYTTKDLLLEVLARVGLGRM